MRITLDIDEYAVADVKRYVENKLKLIDITFDSKFVEIWDSSGPDDGRHIIIYDVDCTYEEALQFRKKLGDDEKRVKFDRHRSSQYGLPYNILFDAKYDGEAEILKTLKTSKGGIT